MHHRGGRFRPPRFLPFRAGARRSLHRRDCFFRLTYNSFEDFFNKRERRLFFFPIRGMMVHS